MRRYTLAILMLILGLIMVVAACGPAPAPTGLAEEETEETMEEETHSDDGDEAAQSDEADSDDDAMMEEEPEEAAAPVATGEIQPPSQALIDQLPGYDESDIITTETGLQYIIYEEGAGLMSVAGENIIAHYSGYLADGTKFDSSRDRGQTFSFPLGQGRVISAWDEAFALLPQGSRALIIVPAELGYGAAGSPPAIPPNSTLYFDIEHIEPPKATVVDEGDFTDLGDGLKVFDFAVGDGATIEAGQIVVMDYAFWDSNGQAFANSDDRGPLRMIYGTGWFPLEGLDLGIEGMQVGGSRQIVIPPALVEGSGLPGEVDYIFEVEITEVVDGPPPAPEYSADDLTTLESGVSYIDVVDGDGAELAEGITFQATYNAYFTDGELLDSSLITGQPALELFGQSRFPGWNEGLAGMKEGGKRIVVVPGDLVGPVRSEVAEDLIFEVEIVPLPDQ